MKKAFMFICCLLAVVGCGQKKVQAATSDGADSVSTAEQAQIETDGEGNHVLTLLQLFNAQHKTTVGTEALKAIGGQWGKKVSGPYDAGWVKYLSDYWVVEAYVDPGTKAETMQVNMLGEDTDGEESLELQTLPKKDGGWWCLVAFKPKEDLPQYYCYDLRDGKLNPTKSLLDTYQKTHESMVPWVRLDRSGTGIDIEESFSATYTLRVNQRLKWDGEQFTLAEITVNNGLEEEKKACFQKLEKEAFQFDKFALVPAGGTLGLLLSDNDEEGQALFNLGPYDTEEPVQMLLCTSRVYGVFTFKYFEHGTVEEQGCGSGCQGINYVLMDHWTVSHRLFFSVGFDDYDEATDTYHVAGDVSYELDGRALGETEGEQMRRQIVSQLGKELTVKPKWIKIGKQ